MGRPSKGQRARLSIRTPHTLHRQVIAEAARRGMTVNDWAVWAMKTAIPVSKRRTGPIVITEEAS